MKIEGVERTGKDMDSNELKGRTKEFAHRCVKLSTGLPNTPLGSHLRGQLIRCSTSVASDYRAACIAQSRASFVSKLSIVVEEVDESHFWLEFIIDEGLLKRNLVEALLTEAGDLTGIFVSSRKTAQANKLEMKARDNQS
ncbi:MAG: four helix bundle protein [Deltaproteobacteria bacterium]